MKKASDVSREELRELLNQNWMTHDAMWFLHCMDAFGIEKTNELNRRAIESMASFEIVRIKKLLNIESVENYSSLKSFVLESFSLIRPDFMKFDISFPGKNQIRWRTEACFAHKGMERLGVEKKYECGIYVRVDSWLNGLGIHFKSVPESKDCMMCSQPWCERTYTVEL